MDDALNGQSDVQKDVQKELKIIKCIFIIINTSKKSLSTLLKNRIHLIGFFRTSTSKCIE